MPRSVDMHAYVSQWPQELPAAWMEEPPWQIAGCLEERLLALIVPPGPGWILDGLLLRHSSATMAPSVTAEGPVIVGPQATVSPNVCLRGGVFLGEGVHIGSSCEIKSSLVLAGSAVAHLNYIGNSLLGAGVNIEAGAVLANHFNEREDKAILVNVDGTILRTGAVKFGALVGDRCRIGANAVTTPGTLLLPGSIVGRLQLIDQVAEATAR